MQQRKFMKEAFVLKSTWNCEDNIKQNSYENKRKKQRINQIQIAIIFTIWTFCFVMGLLSNFHSTAKKSKSNHTYKTVQNNDLQINNNKPLHQKTIVVDAGHGGSDSGTIGVSSGIYESEINLQIANLLSEELKRNGATVIMTRTEETTKSFELTDNLSMDEREKIIENARADMLISIHQNFNEQSQNIKGVQILIRNDRDIDFASKLQKVFNEVFKVNLNYLQGKYLLLSFGNQPSLIVECGFLSNPEEEMLLQNLEHQQKIVEILTKEIIKSFTVHMN